MQQISQDEDAQLRAGPRTNGSLVEFDDTKFDGIPSHSDGIAIATLTRPLPRQAASRPPAKKKQPTATNDSTKDACDGRVAGNDNSTRSERDSQLLIRSLIFNPTQILSELHFVKASLTDTKVCHLAQQNLAPEQKRTVSPLCAGVGQLLQVPGHDVKAPPTIPIDCISKAMSYRSWQRTADSSQLDLRRDLLLQPAHKLRIFDVGISFMAPKTGKAWSIRRRPLVSHDEDQACKGIAPNENLEKRIEETHKRICVCTA